MPITTTTSTISDQYLTDIADAIRSKNGSSDTYTPPQMATAINALDTGGGGSANIQELTVTPTTSVQTFNASGIDGYKPVNVGAMPLGVVTAPSTIVGSSASILPGSNIITLRKNVSVTPSVTTVGYVSSGVAGTSDISLSATVTTKAAATITPSTINQTIASGTYLTGTQTISGDANLIASNIKSGVPIFGVTGTYEGSGGGASNYVTGTFTVGSTGGKVETVTIPYAGSGYPLSGLIYPEGGPYNNTSTGQIDWYNSLVRYAVGFFSWIKSVTTSTPTYGTSGAQNQATVTVVYKNSTTSATTYLQTSSRTAYLYNSGTATGNSNSCVRFKGNGTTLTYYTANNTSSTYGLLPNITYRYQIIYSS